MSENGEVTKAMLQPETGLTKAIGKGADLSWFESLVVTDGPAKQPNERCIVTFALPLARC